MIGSLPTSNTVISNAFRRQTRDGSASCAKLQRTIPWPVWAIQGDGADHGTAAAGADCRTGSVTRNVVPSPTTLRTSMRP
jgi:hypothetical protein